MTKLLLSIHVLAAILTVGPVAVTASLFPRYASRVPVDAEPSGTGTGSDREPSGRGPEFAEFLHGICRRYSLAGVAVPVFGFATGAQLGVLTDAWLIASIVLTSIAAVVLIVTVLPDQERALAALGDGTAPLGQPPATSPPSKARLAMTTGVFNLLWTVVVVLMIVRPGSTTGA
ncbi:hypothetical protein ACFV0R_26145 [Streptomyces sp. NPDC059578]|uniref:hypothetical protein n=1 Tax=unclassified Streptomyces TaxID=2593676 RepID=UPI003665C2BB